MQTLKDLYYFCAEITELEDSPEVAGIKEQLTDQLLRLPEDTRKILEDLYAAAARHSEIQGFTCGFRYAMQIAGECWIGGTPK